MLLDFLRDDVQVFVALIGGDGAVQHAVHKAANGGHRGLEFMADIADKAARQLVELGKVARHVVEGGRQFVNFNTAVVLRDTDIKIACRIFPGRHGHDFERRGHARRNKIRDDQIANQRH